MIYSNFSMVTNSGELALQDGAVLTTEGAALVGVMADGVMAVTPSTGAADEVFVGVALTKTSAASFSETTHVKVEASLTVAGDKVTLARTPVAATVSVWNPAAGAAVAVDSLSGKDVVFLTGQNNNVLTVTYRYALTAVEAQFIMGDATPGGYAGNVLGRVGVAQAGVVFTNAFDSSANWNETAVLKLGANGQFTAGGSGGDVNGYVTQAPTPDYPYLGIQFNASA